MPNTVTKPWWQSITIYAGIFQLLGGAGLAGINIDFSTGDFDGNLWELLASLNSMATGVATIYGRTRAKFRITK